jgi:DNA-binding MarR family transcriptional regulator
MNEKRKVLPFVKMDVAEGLGLTEKDIWVLQEMLDRIMKGQPKIVAADIADVLELDLKETKACIHKLVKMGLIKEMPGEKRKD